MLNYLDPNWLEQAKALTGMTTGELARASGVHRSQIQRLANGAAPRLDTFKKILKAVEDRAEKAA